MGSNLAEKMSDTTDMIFNMSVMTPYTEQEIIEFMMLTGLDIMKTQNIINRFFTCGISNLTDINILAKLGLLKLS